MATEYITFSGKAKWAQRLFVADPKFQKWSVQLYFDPESLDKFREAQVTYQLKNVLKKDDDGYYANFSRPESKRMGTRVVGFAPPKVTYNKEPYQGNIGNGSDITVMCELYSYKDPFGKKGHAIRMESVRIDNLISFDLDNDINDPKDKEAYQRSIDAPEPLF